MTWVYYVYVELLFTPVRHYIGTLVCFSSSNYALGMNGFVNNANRFFCQNDTHTPHSNHLVVIHLNEFYLLLLWPFKQT